MDISTLNREIINNRISNLHQEAGLTKIAGLDYSKEPLDGAKHATSELLLKGLSMRHCKEGWLSIVPSGLRSALCNLPDCELSDAQLQSDEDFVASGMMDPVPHRDRVGQLEWRWRVRHPIDQCGPTHC